MSDRQTNVDRFYRLLGVLAEGCGGMRTLAESDGQTGWPRRGVYLFFEAGETRDDGVTPRVVRVGTHALRPSQSTLWKRLSQHKGTTGGSMPGGGNHRGSVFRLHVGTAMLASGDRDWPRGIRESWATGSTGTRKIRESEYPLERAVSNYIGRMPFLWLGVEDQPGPQSDRGVIEAGSIALLSNVGRPPIDAPSHGWLGNHADRRLIRESGLWNVNHVQDPPNAAFLSTLEGYIT